MAAGDVVTSAGGEPIKSASELARKVQRMTPGSQVQLGLLRNGKESSVGVTLGEMPDEPAAPKAQQQ